MNLKVTSIQLLTTALLWAHSSTAESAAAGSLETTFSCADGSVDAIISGAESTLNCDAFEFMYDTLRDKDWIVSDALSTVLTDSSSFTCGNSGECIGSEATLSEAGVGDEYVYENNTYTLDVIDLSDKDRYGCITQQVDGAQSLQDEANLVRTFVDKRSDPACIDNTLDLVKEATEDYNSTTVNDDDDGCNKFFDGNWFTNMWCPIDEGRKNNPTLFWGIICSVIGICVCCVFCSVLATVAPGLVMAAAAGGGEGGEGGGGDDDMKKMAMMAMM
eukprot:CAMPEP_0119013980 /NCGR_PEP_ID=MMETSP1176-20130426/9289_1 /TAXON_ID=265551 /ORGANISM="Synedropsis recta cf, Strain CCMP1620" /LENGTH=273 /DNA_ID=CAMNT_0006967113 /DNA_START=33 /DNA_END=854 /DNA_ORIENTATION=-